MILQWLADMEMDALRIVGINRLKSQAVQDGLDRGIYYFYLESGGRVFWSTQLTDAIGDDRFYLGSWETKC
jgi:hypothetical protein